MNPGNDPALTPPASVFLSPAPQSCTGRYRFTVRHMFLGVTFALLLLAVVVPNSLQVTTAAAMGLAFMLALPGLRIGPGFRTLLALYACTVIVTVVYMVVGGMHDAPQDAEIQVAAIYILSPLLWTIIAD